MYLLDKKKGIIGIEYCNRMREPKGYRFLEIKRDSEIVAEIKRRAELFSNCVKYKEIPRLIDFFNLELEIK